MSKKLKGLKIFWIIFFASLFVVGSNYVVNKIKNSNYFTVKTVVCKGVVNANQAEVDKVVNKFIGKNIFSINEKTRVLIDDIWIRKAIISKKFPNKLIVKIYEKKPLFVFKKRGRCYQYISGGDMIRISCKKRKINIYDLADNDILNDFSYIFQKNNINFGEIKLHRSYFEIKNKDLSFLCPYNDGVFKRNFDVFQKAIRKRYKQIKYVDLRVKGKIYVDGVLHETG